MFAVGNGLLVVVIKRAIGLDLDSLVDDFEDKKYFVECFVLEKLLGDESLVPVYSGFI